VSGVFGVPASSSGKDRRLMDSERESDSDGGCVSPRSGAASMGKRGSAVCFPGRTKSDDRLYNMSSSVRIESEAASLLSYREGPRSYLSTPAIESSDPFDVPGGSPGHLGMLTRKISRVFQSKAYDYDSNKHSLAAVGSGERVWVGDYRTIDWVHDSVKDKFRKKKLRNIPGLRGAIVNALDAIEGWLLVGLIGIITACIAYCIDVWESVFFDWKEGYCTTSWALDKKFCCWNVKRTWSKCVTHARW
jgi:hypothetical protein